MQTPTRSIGILGALMLALALLVSAPALAGEAEWKAHMDAGTSAYRAATTRFKAALQDAELFGTSDPRLARTLNDLVVLYRAQGNYTEAEPLMRRALGIYETTLGADHQDVAMALNNLAALYEMQGRYAEAEPLNLRSLAIREKTLGRDHLV